MHLKYLETESKWILSTSPLP